MTNGKSNATPRDETVGGLDAVNAELILPTSKSMLLNSSNLKGLMRPSSKAEGDEARTGERGPVP